MPSDSIRPGPRPADDSAASVPPTAAPPPVVTESPARKHSVSRAAWLALIIGVIALIFMLVFILQNNVATQFNFLAWTFTVPLGVAVLFAAIGGALVTAMVGTVRMIVLGRNVRHLEQQRATRA